MTRRTVDQYGVTSLVVDDVTYRDLPSIVWSGNARHLQAVAEVLDRVATGATHYLAVRSPDGIPVAIGAIDYEEAAGVGTIFQLSVHEQLQGIGLGTLLIQTAEKRIRARGTTIARLAAEDDNPRARALYERLGYVESGRREVSWESQRDDGSVFLYETEITELDKHLG